MSAMRAVYVSVADEADQDAEGPTRFVGVIDGPVSGEEDSMGGVRIELRSGGPVARRGGWLERACRCWRPVTLEDV